MVPIIFPFILINIGNEWKRKDTKKYHPNDVHIIVCQETIFVGSEKQQKGIIFACVTLLSQRVTIHMGGRLGRA
jgi:hypothetical protein